MVERVLGPGIRVALIDAACASSLYAMDVGARALLDERCELALCGGWFAPGPANSCLFSQFSGLSGVDSRPFDRAADGVVFGEGATVLALRRLPDALARGERVHWSSDGSVRWKTGATVSPPTQLRRRTRVSPRRMVRQ